MYSITIFIEKTQQIFSMKIINFLYCYTNQNNISACPGRWYWIIWNTNSLYDYNKLDYENLAKLQNSKQLLKGILHKVV